MPPDIPGGAQNLPNPFDYRVVTGPYDPSHVVVVEPLLRGPMKQLLAVLERHARDPLAPLPVVTVVGPTGAGKSHLLRVLTEWLHRPARPPHGLVVDIAPREFAAQPEATADDDADRLLSRIETVLMRSRLPGFGPLRPVDVFAHRIARVSISTLGDAALQLPRRASSLFRRPQLPEAIGHTLTRSLPPDRPLLELLEGLDDPTRRALLERLVEGVRSQPWAPVREAILRHALLPVAMPSIFDGASGPNGRSAIEWLHQFVGLAHDIALPLLVTFDQFENLRAAGSGDAQLNVLVNRFIQRVIEVLTRLKEFGDGQLRAAAGQRLKGSTGSRLPLVVLSVIDEYDPTQLSEEHIKGRLPWISSDGRAIRLEPAVKRLRDFGLARELAQSYLDEFWLTQEGLESAGVALGRELWPFGADALQLLHRQLSPHTATPRAWLELCARAWDRLVTEGPPEEYEGRLARWKAEMQALVASHPAAAETDDDHTSYADNVDAATLPAPRQTTSARPAGGGGETPTGAGVRPALGAASREALARRGNTPRPAPKDPVVASGSDAGLPSVPAPPASATASPATAPSAPAAPAASTRSAASPLPATPPQPPAPALAPPGAGDAFHAGRFVNVIARHPDFRKEVTDLCGRAVKAHADAAADQLFRCLNLAVVHRVAGLLDAAPEWSTSDGNAFTFRSHGHRVLALVTSGSAVGVQNDWARAGELVEKLQPTDLLFMRTREVAFPFEVPERLGRVVVHARWKVLQDWSRVLCLNYIAGEWTPTVPLPPVERPITDFLGQIQHLLTSWSLFNPWRQHPLP